MAVPDLPFKDILRINFFVQDIVGYCDLENWFINMAEIEQRNTIANLLFLVMQSHPDYGEIETASDIAKLKRTYTPCVLILDKNKPYSKFGYKLISLPSNELVKTFKLLLYTLKTADTRRKNSEKECNCNHWWHKDLRDNAYVESLIDKFS